MKLTTVVKVSVLTKSTRVGPRVRARAKGIRGCLTVPYDHRLTLIDNLKFVADLFADKHRIGERVGYTEIQGKKVYLYQTSSNPPSAVAV